MNILQFNVRLAEGGAAGVALDLHQRALQQGAGVTFCLRLRQRRQRERQPSELSAGHQTYAADDRDGEYCSVSSV